MAPAMICNTSRRLMIFSRPSKPRRATREFCNTEFWQEFQPGCKTQPVPANDGAGTRALPVNEQANDQRGEGKHAKNAKQYRYQPNGPAAVVLDNLKPQIGQIRKVLPRHRTPLKADRRPEAVSPENRFAL